MPAEGMQWLPRSEVLSFEEIERIVRLFAQDLGLKTIRLTGGEPLMRAHLPLLISKLAAIRTRSGEPLGLSLTTNGSTLAAQAAALAGAGLSRINISLDSLQRERFAELTRRDELNNVLEGIAAAQAAGLEPVKINCVVMSGVNEEEILDFARFGRESGVLVRFIEFMPLDADQRWARDQVVSLETIVERINAEFPCVEVESGNDPAQRYRYRDGGGSFGVIASVTRQFCDRCDRLRLTAEGGLRNCLFGVDEYGLRDLLRSGASDAELTERIVACVHAKWAGHSIGTVNFIRPTKSMSQIGG
jgi:cyclic pyranopterin phosphate synthase